jgi:hypothetical protein
LAACTLALVVPGITSAQDAPNWDAIRRTDLTGIDRQTVEKWVNTSVGSLFAAEPGGALEAGTTFMQTVRQQNRAADASDGFRRGLSDVITKAFLDRYTAAADAKAPRPQAAAIVIAALSELARPEALPAFQAAIKDPESAPRAVAAGGLLRIRAGLSNDQWAAVAQAIQTAAAEESSGAVLSRMYRFLSVESDARAADAARAILAIMDERFKRFEQNWSPPTQADAEILPWLAARAAQTNDAVLRKDTVLRIARLLADATHVYVERELPESYRKTLQKVIAAAESQLKRIANPPNPPNVTAALTAALTATGDEGSKRSRILGELAKWVGMADADGVLNQPPFELPRKLGVERPPPPRPATAPSG